MSRYRDQFVVNTGISRATVLVSDEVKVGNDITMKSKDSVVTGKFQFHELEGNGNDIVFADNNGTLLQILSPTENN